jgi:hypothetical protein
VPLTSLRGFGAVRRLREADTHVRRTPQWVERDGVAEARCSSESLERRFADRRCYGSAPRGRPVALGTETAVLLPDSRRPSDAPFRKEFPAAITRMTALLLIRLSPGKHPTTGLNLVFVLALLLGLVLLALYLQFRY